MSARGGEDAVNRNGGGRSTGGDVRIVSAIVAGEGEEGP